MFKVRKLHFSRGEKKIIDDISIDVKSGEIVALVGKNGEGKSTLIDLFSGILRGRHNEISYNNFPIENIALRKLSGIRAVLAQKFNMQFNMSVYEFLLLSKRIKGKLKEDDFQAVDEVIEKFELKDFIKREILSLSGGEQQRVILARTILQLYPFSEDQAAYLFLDEPMAALDLEIQQKTMRILRSLVKSYNLGVIIVVHDLNQASLYCDRVWILSQGKIRVDEAPKKALTSKNIEDYFNIDVNISMINNRPIITF